MKLKLKIKVQRITYLHSRLGISLLHHLGSFGLLHTGNTISLVHKNVAKLAIGSFGESSMCHFSLHIHEVQFLDHHISIHVISLIELAHLHQQHTIIDCLFHSPPLLHSIRTTLHIGGWNLQRGRIVIRIGGLVAILIAGMNHPIRLVVRVFACVQNGNGLLVQRVSLDFTIAFSIFLLSSLTRRAMLTRRGS